MVFVEASFPRGGTIKKKPEVNDEGEAAEKIVSIN